MSVLKTAIAAMSLGLTTITGSIAAEDIEKPKYDVLKSAEGVELRRYEPRIVAQVTVEAESRDAASSKGFMPLADYIFGNNKGSDKIAMTAPVTTQPSNDDGRSKLGGDGTKIDMTAPVTTSQAGEGGSYTVRFMMPAKWTMETLPKPVNDKVELKEMAGEKMIAAGFTGKKTAEAMEKAEMRVIEFAKKEGLTFVGPFTSAGYDGPQTPESERRWEVMRPVGG